MHSMLNPIVNLEDDAPVLDLGTAFNETALAVQTLMECRQILEAAQVTRSKRRSCGKAAVDSAMVKPPEVELAAELRLKEALEGNCPSAGTVWDIVRTVRSVQQQVLDFRDGISSCRRIGKGSTQDMMQRRQGRLAEDETSTNPRSEEEWASKHEDTDSWGNMPWNKVDVRRRRRSTSLSNRKQSSYPLTWLEEDDQSTKQTFKEEIFDF
eukprot:gnl/MRDRNA2_/MRDRNA2_92104_c0_seq1.p1 gnl/MRDRNA2_/MRDRNA2_92104_c0~~gnl/MRDRNA2_/MRDRNA2_92104_c0_seq1.p1  ORF type:complete len:210 (-),score=44.89 gnl/MRDRNA2_/MRDRNA2_92104_c0_seq1:225-854(-)